MKRGLSLSDRRHNYILLAEEAYINDNKEKAVEFYNKALQFGGNIVEDIAILYNMAQIYDEMDMPQDAIKIYERIIDINPKEAGAYYGIAIMEERLNNKEKALEYYHKAIEIDPNYDRAYYFAANLYDEMGDRDKALEYYKKVVELAPNDYIAYNNIGSLYEERGDLKNALKYLNKSLEIEKNYYKTLFNLGVVYYGLGDRQKALEFYFKSKELNPYHESTCLNISAIFIEEKKYLDAINLLTEGIKYNPTAHDLYYNRACCYSILGEKEKAIKDLNQALILFPSIIKYIKADKDFYNLYDQKEFIDMINDYENKINRKGD